MRPNCCSPACVYRPRRQARLTPGPTPECSFPSSVNLWTEMGAFGLHGVTVSEQQGGLGLGYLHHCVAMEELSRASGELRLQSPSFFQVAVWCFPILFIRLPPTGIQQWQRRVLGGNPPYSLPLQAAWRCPMGRTPTFVFRNCAATAPPPSWPSIFPCCSPGSTSGRSPVSSKPKSNYNF